MKKFNKGGKTVENLFEFLYLPQPTPRTSPGQAHDHNQDKNFCNILFAMSGRRKRGREELRGLEVIVSELIG